MWKCLDDDDKEDDDDKGDNDHKEGDDHEADEGDKEDGDDDDENTYNRQRRPPRQLQSPSSAPFHDHRSSTFLLFYF